MSKEYFDLLDENGNKIGKTKLRSDVHRDGDWHKAVHIWIINNNGEILLQRRCSTKDSNPNMLDISSAGHLSAGDNSLSGAIRELKEELNLDVKPEELQFIKTLKRSSKYTATFINNEFDDLYILRTNKKIEDKMEIPKNLNADFRNYQVLGFKWLKILDNYKFGGILADDMGLGKTLQLLAVIQSYLEI